MRVDIVEGGDLGRSVGQDRAIGADIFLDLVEGHGAGIGRGIAGDREGGRLQAHFGFDVRAVDRTRAHRGRRGLLVGGEDRQRIEAGIIVLGLVVGRKPHLDMGKGLAAHDLAFAVMGNGGDLEDCLVDGAGGDFRREQPSAARHLVGPEPGGGGIASRRIGLGRDRQLLATVKCGKKSNPHEDA